VYTCNSAYVPHMSSDLFSSVIEVGGVFRIGFAQQKPEGCGQKFPSGSKGKAPFMSLMEEVSQK